MNAMSRRIADLAHRFGLRDVYVFGSRAAEIAARVRGELREPAESTSDVDIGVQPLPGRALDAHDRVRLAIEFEDLFRAPRVDLVVLAEARPFLAVDVIRGELIYTADPLGQAEHELYILRRAADLAPFEKARVARILREGAR